MEKICFIILHYKDQEITDKCIKSILKITQKEMTEIIIIDNASNNNSGQNIQRIYENVTNVRVLFTGENLGFSKANNWGIKYAVDNFAPKFVVVTNNDIEFAQKNFVNIIDKLYEEKDFDILGPDIIKKGTGEHQNPMCKKLRTLKETKNTINRNKFVLKYYDLIFPVLQIYNFFRDIIIILKKNISNKTKSNYRQEQENVILFGACLIFSWKYLKNHSQIFFPETFFFYEEFILMYHAFEIKSKVIYSPQIKVLHESGAATKLTYRSAKIKTRFLIKNIIDSCEVYQKMILDDLNR